MGDTMFNIFGGDLDDDHRKVLISAIKLHPSKKLLASFGLTPRPKRKTFLQNEGAAIQAFCPTKKLAQTANAKVLEVYEDAVTVEPRPAERAEYNRKPMFHDDCSDEELEITEEKLNIIAFGLPSSNALKPIHFTPPKMCSPVEPDFTIADILKDDIPEPDEINTDLDFPEPIFELDELEELQDFD